MLDKLWFLLMTDLSHLQDYPLSERPDPERPDTDLCPFIWKSKELKGAVILDCCKEKLTLLYAHEVPAQVWKTRVTMADAVASTATIQWIACGQPTQQGWSYQAQLQRPEILYQESQGLGNVYNTMRKYKRAKKSSRTGAYEYLTQVSIAFCSNTTSNFGCC